MRVKAAGRTFRLTAARAHLAADVNGMVDEAVDASREGGLPCTGLAGADRWRGRTAAWRRT